MGVVRPPAGVALAVFALLLPGGCSAIIAAAGRADDLSVVYVGAERGEVEDTIGSPSRVRLTADGTEAVYKVRVGRAGSPGQNAGAVGRAGLDTFAEVTANLPVSQTKPVMGVFGAALAVPVMIGTDIVLSVREFSHIVRRRRRLVVHYDARERVVSHRLRR